MTFGRVNPTLALLAGALIALGVAASAPYFPERFSDVRAFYCAGRATLARADPYREHPLAECQRGVAAPGLSALRGGVAIPAPFPGCVLALFALLALLPFPGALALWMTAAIGALIGAIALVARVTATPPSAAAIVLGFPALAVALPLGQVTPFVLLALAGAARCLQLGRPRTAAAAALGAMLDPHVGVALILGLFVAVPAVRATSAIGAAALLAVGSAVSGPAHEWEYVRAVLPAHALANIADATQFSISNFAFAAGMAAPMALGLGSLWYALALALGSFLGWRLRGRLGEAAPALVPPAFAVFGGTHTHLAQLALAVPAFLLVTSATRDESRRVAYALLTFVAAIPWLLLAPFPLLFPATAVLAAAFARIMAFGRCALVLALASAATLGLTFIAIVRSHIEHGTIDARVDGNPLAETAWQLFVLARNEPPESWHVFAKGPTVIAFVALFVVLIDAARRRVAIVSEC